MKPGLEIWLDLNKQHDDVSLLNFYWNFTKWSEPTQMELQLEFEHTYEVSIYSPKEILKVKFWANELF